MATWIEELARHRVDVQEAGFSSGQGDSLGPCPACGAERRGRDDKRGPVGTTRDRRGWRCWAEGCEAGGDLADVLGYRLFGKRVRELTQDQIHELKAEAARTGLISDPTPYRVTSPAAVYSARSGVLGDVVAELPTTPADEEEVVFASQGRASPFAWREGLPSGAHRALWSDPDAAPVLEYLRTGRGFSDEVIRSFGLGAMLLRSGGRVVERWLTIPLPHQDPVSVKFRSVPGPCLYCSPDGLSSGSGCDHCRTKKNPAGGTVPKRMRACAGRPTPLFGDLSEPGRPVTIVGGELDVVAMNQLGYRTNVISGTTGEKAAWPDAWLDRVEPFPSFLIGLDNDEVGHASAKKLAEQLGRHRSSRVLWPAPGKDPNECLVRQVSATDIHLALDDATSFTKLRLSSPDEFAQQIEHLINNPGLLKGQQCSIPAINDALGGFLPGLYVFSGETGHGKTSFATFLLWDLATRGTPVLITSFEQTPIGSVMKMLRMELGGDFTTGTPGQRFAGLASLKAKGIRVVDKYGDVTDDQVVEAIRYARRRRGCRFALIDHLDFIVRIRRNGEDERQAKERVIRDLTTIAVDEDIAIFLVVHPNNLATNQARRVQLTDCKGASAIRQDAHVGIVVERLEPTAARAFPAAMVYFDKVRSEFGQAGAQRVLAYDPLACWYAARWEDTPSYKNGTRVVVP